MSGRPGSLVNHPARVSFTVRRPSPLSSRQSSTGPESKQDPSFRVPPIPTHSPLGLDDQEDDQPDADSSDEDDAVSDELVSGFDSMGVQRVKPTTKPAGPLVIAPLANKDWRAVARSRQAAKGYVPDSARGAAMTGPDGSQGGLGTKDSINSGPQLSGLVQVAAKQNMDVSPQTDETDGDTSKAEDTEMAVAEPLDEDARALQALLRGDASAEETQPELEAIPLNEEDAFKRDMAELPDVATLDDYARVPVSQFGAAMLRGMGWKPPAKGDGEPWVPNQRPALLGLGAKPKAADSDVGSKAKPKWMQREKDRKYVPLVKKERDEPVTDGGSARASRASSRSRSPPARGESARRSDRRDYREKDRAYDSDRDRARERSYRDSDREREKDRDYRRDRDNRSTRDSRSERGSDRDRGSRRDRDSSDSRRR